MKNLIIIFLIFLSVVTKGTDYTVGSDGDYTSITALNADKATFSAGDNIDFKRGETFYGTIEIAASGTSGNPITYGAYDTGADPIITGFTTITGWTDETGGIYSKVITSDSQTNMVTVDGVNTGRGRYPDATYNTFESHNAKLSITDNQLASTPNWTGAQVVIRIRDWSRRRKDITDHTGTTITYSPDSGFEPKDDNGYFITNDLLTLTAQGEWYHDTATGKFYMYFGTNDPDDYDVRVATVDNLIDVQASYITIEDLDLEGSIGALITSNTSTNITIQNSSLQYAGFNGITLLGQYSVVNNCTISDVNENGVRILADNCTVKESTITNCGLILGASEAYYIGIMGNLQSNTLIEYNTIRNIGYDGIGVWGLNNTIRYNFIDSVCLTLNDGGGIYTTNSDNLSSAGTVIDHNIVLNSIGDIEGAESPTEISEGIYLDEFAEYVTVTNNTVAYNAYSGFKLHKAHDNRIEYNISYANRHGTYLNGSSESAITLYDDTVRYNQFIASEGTDNKTLYARDLYANAPTDSVGLGVYDYNIYAKPASTYTMSTKYPSTDYVSRTLSGWQTYSNQDANSEVSPIVITDDAHMRLIYNATKESVTYDVTGSSVTGMDATVYSSTISIQSFESIVIIGADVDLVLIQGTPPVPTPTIKRLYKNTINGDIFH